MICAKCEWIVSPLDDKARRADHFRAHLLVETKARATLQRFLGRWLPLVAGLQGSPGLRWSIDVDPLEVD